VLATLVKGATSRYTQNLSRYTAFPV